MNNLFIISSNCKNGPTEFLNDGEGGILFESDEKNALFDAFNSFLDFLSSQIYLSKIKVAKKNCKKYSLLSHHVILISRILRS